MWFRNDLRLADNPALLTAHQAAGASGTVLGVYVVDELAETETAHQVWRCAALADLNDRMGGALVVRSGDPLTEIMHLAEEVAADTVHITADCTPAGRDRDQHILEALHTKGRALVATGTPYVLGPGTVTKGDGTGYAVFTPFYKAWQTHQWPAPAPDLTDQVRWHTEVTSDPLPTHQGWSELTTAPEAGELTALARFDDFIDGPIAAYDVDRDLPAKDGTSMLSAALAHGQVHPRTLLAKISHRGDPDTDRYRSELAWREFYADVLFRHPHTVTGYYRDQLAGMEFDEPGEQLRAWKFGHTGFPFVDAGMRQLRSTGWMHNRVRMVVASFLIKDLHIEWQHGAQWFMRNLYDADVASNSHGWQWVAGCGTDASPYFRVFNPITQGIKFDPSGAYIRKYVPELAHLPGKLAHEPWKAQDGYDHGYAKPLVDHAEERKETLRRYELVRK